AGHAGCRTVVVAGASDDLCTSDMQCGVGFTCTKAGATKSSCRKFCSADSQCGSGSRCAFGLTNAHGQSLNVKVCSNACNILAQTGCPSGLGCLGLESSGGDFTDCRQMDGKLDGDPCATQTECLPGSACVSSGGALSCASYCDTASSVCSNGQSCTD